MQPSRRGGGGGDRSEISGQRDSPVVSNAGGVELDDLLPSFVPFPVAGGGTETGNPMHVGGGDEDGPPRRVRDIFRIPSDYVDYTSLLKANQFFDQAGSPRGEE